MNKPLLCSLFFLLSLFVYAQTDDLFLSDSLLSVDADSLQVVNQVNDSLNAVYLNSYKESLMELEQLRVKDSTEREELKVQLNSLKTTDNLKKDELQKQLEELQQKDSIRIAQKKKEINSLKSLAVGYPVYGPLNDTIFFIYNNIGSFSAYERSTRIAEKVKDLYHDDFLSLDSITVSERDDLAYITYGNIIIMTVVESDALWNDQSIRELAEYNVALIKASIENAKKEKSLSRALGRVGLTLLVLIIVYLVIWLINKLYSRALRYVTRSKDKFLKDLSYKDYTFLSAEQELKGLFIVLKILRGALIVLSFFIMLPIVFSIFPFTRGWADYLFGLLWTPIKGMGISVWNYLPDLFSIVIIYFAMKYVIRFVKYIFSEIESGKLKISGFHPDWSMPTYHIVRFLLMAFGVIIIFPHLPNAESDTFKGVSVFLGVLISLGSSSAIANLIAGLIITYMRPFKIGDRIRVGDISGDVVEKTVLVTRLRTVKNEEITIPNSTILSGNTINYSTYSKTDGLIIHTNVTMGYECPWQEVQEALLEAADRTNLILKTPRPFVLQVSLDDFYVSYQLNAYIREVNKQAAIYSNLHQNIQDVFNERGFEGVSPYYQAMRDGNKSTLPEKYLPH